MQLRAIALAAAGVLVVNADDASGETRRLQLPVPVGGVVATTTAAPVGGVVGTTTVAAIQVPVVGVVTTPQPGGCGPSGQICPLGNVCNVQLGVCSVLQPAPVGTVAPGKKDDGDDETYGAVEATSQRVFMEILINIIISVVLAFIYKTRVVDRMPVMQAKRPGEGQEIWEHYGLFACCSDMNTCLYVWCLPHSVAAKNFEKTDVLGFWPSFGMLILSYNCCCCIGPILRTVFIGKMKERLGIQHSFVGDCLLNMCCFQCEIGRESMLIDEELGVEVSCPFQVNSRYGGPMAMGGMGGMGNMGGGMLE